MKFPMDKFEDLQIGDQVSFSGIYVHDKLRASGQGKVYGFGRFDQTDLVWVDTRESDGRMWAVPYEKIIKI